MSRKERRGGHLLSLRCDRMKYAPHVECPEQPGQMDEEMVGGGEEGGGAAYANGVDGEREGKGRWGWGSAESLNDESGEGRAWRGWLGGRQSIPQPRPSFTECCLALTNQQEKQPKKKKQSGDTAMQWFCAVASQVRRL